MLNITVAKALSGDIKCQKVLTFYGHRKTSMLLSLGRNITLVKAAEAHDVYHAVQL